MALAAAGLTSHANNFDVGMDRSWPVFGQYVPPQQSVGDVPSPSDVSKVVLRKAKGKQQQGQGQGLSKMKQKSQNFVEA